MHVKNVIYRNLCHYEAQLPCLVEMTRCQVRIRYGAHQFDYSTGLVHLFPSHHGLQFLPVRQHPGYPEYALGLVPSSLFRSDSLLGHDRCGGSVSRSQRSGDGQVVSILAGGAIRFVLERLDYSAERLALNCSKEVMN
jgi:hypothetical protein